MRYAISKIYTIPNQKVGSVRYIAFILIALVPSSVVAAQRFTNVTGAAGLYLYRLSVGEYSVVKELVVK